MSLGGVKRHTKSQAQASFSQGSDSKNNGGGGRESNPPNGDRPFQPALKAGSPPGTQTPPNLNLLAFVGEWVLLVSGFCW